MEIPVNKEDQRLLATWAAECAEHVLALFEAAHPGDDRPRQAIEAARAWVRTGEFRMDAVRRDSLAAHAAARDAEPGSAPQFAARAAGHAVATAHVPSHAIGSAWYAAKAADAAHIPGEREWQVERLPRHLRPYIHQLAQAKPGLARVLRYPTDWAETR